MSGIWDDDREDRDFLRDLEDIEPDTPFGQSTEIPPEKALAAYEALSGFIDTFDRLRHAVTAFEKLLPRRQPTEIYTMRRLKNEFFGVQRSLVPYRAAETLNPVGVALVTVDKFFKNSDRFQVWPVKNIPNSDKLLMGSPEHEPVFTPIRIAGEAFMVPDKLEVWLEDRTTGVRYFVSNEIKPGYALFTVEAGKGFEEPAKDLLEEVRDEVHSSPLFRGRVLEMSRSGFQVIELGEVEEPKIDPLLKSEIEKNVINVFRKKDEFKRFKMPAVRSIIMEGPQGVGKSMAARHLASMLQGEVTTLWVTAKSVGSASEIASIFEFARKLCPALIVMEDLDLLAGSREHHEECLGEMLAQLDSLQESENIVLLASTNRVRSLDIALKDRPKRFDRIWQFGLPTAELARDIAVGYFKRRNVAESVIEELSFSTVTKGDLTGAQIEEVCKGAIVEAIGRGCDVDDRCVMASYKGLQEQRRIVLGEDH